MSLFRPTRKVYAYVRSAEFKKLAAEAEAREERVRAATSRCYTLIREDWLGLPTPIFYQETENE